MSVAEQFAGLDMKSLIGGPLTAAADASILLARSTADFINDVGFDANGKVRTAAFGYERRSANDDGTSNLEEMKVAVPMLALRHGSQAARDVGEIPGLGSLPFGQREIRACKGKHHRKRQLPQL